MNVNGYEIKPFANLKDADLTGADLTGADLTGADLRWSVLKGADLTGADLTGADLRWSDLRWSDLTGADLTGADLRWSDLTGADLTGAVLKGAVLKGAVLKGAVLKDADLTGANLAGADLAGADLRGADLTGANLPHFQIVPEEGSFIAYKKVDTGVIKLLIPEDAKRTSTLVGRKCRASYVKVLEGSGISCISSDKLEYKEGEFVYADKYDDDIRKECTSGIHFFVTKKEADTWR